MAVFVLEHFAKRIHHGWLVFGCSRQLAKVGSAPVA
jgi:hypothetical protein